MYVWNPSWLKGNNIEILRGKETLCSLTWRQSGGCLKITNKRPRFCRLFYDLWLLDKYLSWPLEFTRWKILIRTHPTSWAFGTGSEHDCSRTRLKYCEKQPVFRLASCRVTFWRHHIGVLAPILKVIQNMDYFWKSFHISHTSELHLQSKNPKYYTTTANIVFIVKQRHGNQQRQNNGAKNYKMFNSVQTQILKLDMKCASIYSIPWAYCTNVKTNSDGSYSKLSKRVKI